MKNLTILIALSLALPTSTALRANVIATHGIETKGKAYNMVSGKVHSSIMRTKRIVFNDLDISTPDGHASLLTRVRSAVRYVCGPRGHSVMEKADIARCKIEATAHAMSDLKQSMVRDKKAVENMEAH